MRVLDNIKPENVFFWFEEISKIPHGSGNMEKISEFLESFAKERKLVCKRDENNNVIIKKEGTEGFLKSKPIILQAHLDMVCEKTDDTKIDFLNEPVTLLRNDEFVYAKGTTLGGDNGIGVAYILALLDSKDIPHPPLEGLFTVDEEIGLLGAASVDLSTLNGKRMINLDIEEEGTFTVSCAGGVVANCTLPVEREVNGGTFYEIAISGLKGGHSGVEIDKERGNSNVLMGRLLNILLKACDIRIVSVEGGLKDNAIPVKTVAEVYSKKDISTFIKEYNDILKNEYKSSDPNIIITCKAYKDEKRTLNEKSSKDMVFVINALPNGVYKMSVDIENLPETSLNMGRVITNEDNITFVTSLRSSVESEKMALSDKIKVIVEYAGGMVELSGNYPGWQYNEASELRKTMISVYKKMYNKEPDVCAIHAGLECGMFTSKIEGLDCISIGPEILDIHTPQERANISSVKRVWEFLCETLKELK